VGVPAQTDVGERLGAAGRAVIYNESVYWTGPVFHSASQSENKITVVFSNVSPAGLELRVPSGWEVCQGACLDSSFDGWTPVNASGVSPANQITLMVSTPVDRYVL